MVRRKLALGAVGALVVAAGLTAMVAPSDGDHATSEQVIRVVTHTVAFGHLHLGAAHLSIGGRIPYGDDIYRAGSRMGEDGGWCVLTRTVGSAPDGHGPLAPTYECVGTYSLPGGQLTTQGLVTYGPHEDVRTEPYHLAITGGTGKYVGARGEVKIKEVSGTEARLTFRIAIG